ncbi:MAG TPA: hypothetical protein VHT21_22405 [Stellaceae bacterium]|jgi:hypothetical protein|nr:hypothetical protein [Stellaceae bacterium]
MWNIFGHTALAVAMLAGTAQLAQAQSHPGPAAVMKGDTGTTVLHGTPGEAGPVGEVPGYGSSAPPGYMTSAGGTTVFHGAAAGAPSPWPPPPPWEPPPALGGGR